MDRKQEAAIAMDMELGEESKLPTVAEARARFDRVEGVLPAKVSHIELHPVVLPAAQKVESKAKAPVPTPVPEVTPKKILPSAKKPAPVKPAAIPETAAQEGVKSPSPRLLTYLYSIKVHA